MHVLGNIILFSNGYLLMILDKQSKLAYLICLKYNLKLNTA